MYPEEWWDGSFPPYAQLSILWFEYIVLNGASITDEVGNVYIETSDMFTIPPNNNWVIIGGGMGNVTHVRTTLPPTPVIALNPEDQTPLHKGFTINRADLSFSDGWGGGVTIQGLEYQVIGPILNSIIPPLVEANWVPFIVNARVSSPGRYIIYARQFDIGGNRSAVSFIEITNDRFSPLPVSWSASPGNYTTGQTITITLVLREPVDGYGNVPSLTLNTAGTAVYSGGSGTNKLQFTYTVQSGDSADALEVTTVNSNGVVLKRPGTDVLLNVDEALLAERTPLSLSPALPLSVFAKITVNK